MESLDADASIAPLSAALVDDDAKVRLAAVTALTIVGDDEQRVVREAAADLLSELSEVAVEVVLDEDVSTK